MDITSLGFMAVPAIVVICYVAAEFIKTTRLDNKWIPIFCMIFGGILGIVEMFISSAPADLLSSIAAGIISGLTATGVNQVFKQLKDN